MPKIGLEVGIEPQRKVTKEWIQEKLNSVKALLQGRIDAENLCANSQEQLLKTAKDRPTEVAAYDNSMKFFKKDGDVYEFGKRTPVVDLFMELVNLCNASPDIAVVGGTLDSEMVSTFTTEDLKENDDVQKVYTNVIQKDLEVPPNYIPMTWGELADLMIVNDFELTDIVIDETTGSLSLQKTISADNKKFILNDMLNVNSEENVSSIGFVVEWSSSKTNVNYYNDENDKSKDTFGADVYAPVLLPEFNAPSYEFNKEKNTIEANAEISFYKSLAAIKENYDELDDFKYVNSSGATTVRFIPEFLCKVV